MDDSSKKIFENYLSHYERRSNTYFRSLQEIQELNLERLPRWIEIIPKEARILDAGCATGYLLGLLWEMGYHNLTGVDLSPQLVDVARSQLPQKMSLHVANIHDFLAKTPSGAYDVIMFHHVLEHIPRDQTIKLLREFRRCIVDGGHLSIKTPNAACLLGGSHCFGDITHIVHFNEFSMVQVLEQAGFSVENIKFIAHPPKLFGSLRHPIRSVFRLLNWVRWLLNLMVHRAVCVLMDLRPAPKVSEWELDVLARK